MPERYNETPRSLKEGDRILVRQNGKWLPATVTSVIWRGKSSTTMAKTDDGMCYSVSSEAHWRPMR